MRTSLILGPPRAVMRRCASTRCCTFWSAYSALRLPMRLQASSNIGGLGGQTERIFRRSRLWQEASNRFAFERQAPEGGCTPIIAPYNDGGPDDVEACEQQVRQCSDAGKVPTSAVGEFG